MRQSADQNTGLRPFRVLHIGPSLSDGTGGDSVTAGLRLLNISTAHQLDVYRGLAWLARTSHTEQAHANLQNQSKTHIHSPESAPIVGVVVCVDEFTVAEYEFFELACRYDDLHGVYVYSTYGDTGSVQRAIAHGATGELTDEVLAALRLAIDESLNPSEGDKAETAISKLVQPEMAQPTIRDEEADVKASDEDRFDEATTTQACEAEIEAIDETADDEHIEGDEDDLIGPVQVPWDRRPAPPQRAGPPQRSAPPQQPTTTPAPSSESAHGDRKTDNGDGENSLYVTRPKHQPLLTPEEVRALIGEIEYNVPLEDRPKTDDESA